MPKNDYAKLHEISKTTALLSSICSLIEWDQETYMPAEGIALRVPQIELMANLLHKQKISPRFAKALGKLIDLTSGEILDKSLSMAQIAAVKEWRRDYLNMVKLPSPFVKKFAKSSATSLHAWQKAKEENNFRAFAPHLEKIVILCRKKADLLGYKEHPYDALLDLYEPEMSVASLTPLFERLKFALTGLLKAIGQAPAPNQKFLEENYSSEKQLHFAQILLRAMGFSHESSRLDQSAHPFCTGLHPKDTRMTTHVYPNNVMSSIFSVIHEGGHGIYNSSLKEEHFGSPLGEPISLALDESQSRFWETRIGRSLPFWRHFFPLLQKEFPERLGSVYLEDFYRAVNVVKPSFIRVEADEVTYSLHIIVRFEIEKALIEGSLKVKDLPDAWNGKMREYLGIAPTTNREGCLQDIHWSMGGMGYFPTYTLGNLYASQFFATFEQAYPDWKERVSKGDLLFIREWLKQNILQYGKEFTAKEIIQHVTGEPLSEKHFVNYLERKYKQLYNI
jgi:carboxypeptidase Taq